MAIRSLDSSSQTASSAPSTPTTSLGVLTSLFRIAESGLDVGAGLLMFARSSSFVLVRVYLRGWQTRN